MADAPSPDNDYRISLINSTNTSERVVFVATPDLIETRNISYKNVELTHSPGQMLAYGNSSARSFNLSNVRLISRSAEEARENLEDLWILRSWAMPEFGKSTLLEEHRNNRSDPTVDNDKGIEKRGSPPAVLLLTAYSKSTAFAKSPSHINRVPVVITNMSIPYPSDVDYIPAEGYGVPMPTIMTLDFQLTETHSPTEYENFSLSDFKQGKLGGF